MRRLVAWSGAVLLAMLAGPAFAAGFQQKTMRVPLAVTEVERPLILGRGWLELGLGVDVKDAAGAWTPGGTARAFAVDGTRWLYTTGHLDVRYGITRHAEVYARVPFHYVHLSRGGADPDLATFGLGDPVVGWRVEWFRKHAPTTSITSDLYAKLPAGPEAPGSTIGPPSRATGVPLSTGTFDVGVELAGKHQLGPVAITAGIAYGHSFSGITQYALAVDGDPYAGRFKPGDEVRLRAEPVLQLGPIAVGAEVLYTRRALAAVGSTTPGLFDTHDFTPIAGSDGWSVDVTPGVTVNATRGFDLHAAVGVPIRGEDLVFFPFEDLTPTRGLTWSGGLEVRY